MIHQTVVPGLKDVLQHLNLSNFTEKIPILNNVSNLKTLIFHQICHKIFIFFLSIRKIMTCSTGVSICWPRKRSVSTSQQCSGSVSAVHNPKQTWSVESFSDFAILRQWPSTQEHVFKFHLLNTEQIFYSSQLTVNELYTQSIVTCISRYSFDC